MKKVLVTGATGAIGEAVSKYFASHEYFVYIHCHRNLEKAQTLVEEISHGAVLQFDCSDKESIKTTLESIDVDVLVNCAGIIKDKLFFFMDDEAWESVIETNLNGLYYITKQIVTEMIKNRAGSIVNVASISGIVGNAGQTNYSASKGGVIAFTKALSAEVGRYGIRVNAIAPGVIDSEMIEKVDKNVTKMIPLERLGKPEEVAEVAYFLGDKASYISGEVINVSGGMVR